MEAVMDGEKATLKATEARAEPAPAAPSPPPMAVKPGETQSKKNSKPDAHSIFGETWFPREARRRRD
jgi:hypothetical protein